MGTFKGKILITQEQRTSSFSRPSYYSSALDLVDLTFYSQPVRSPPLEDSATFFPLHQPHDLSSLGRAVLDLAFITTKPQSWLTKVLRTSLRARSSPTTMRLSTPSMTWASSLSSSVVFTPTVSSVPLLS